jgi:hypothetical protein
VVTRLPHELALGPGPREGVWLEIVLREGKKRQIRHMTSAVGHPTLRLVRWAIGALTLGDLAYGTSAQLSKAEVALVRATQAPEARTTRPRRPVRKPESSPRPRRETPARSGRREARPGLRRKRSASARTPKSFR